MIRSNRGQNIDMDALRRNNADQIAVTGGGIRMNANGDIVSNDGTVLKSAEDIDTETMTATSSGSSRVSLTDMRKVRDADPELKAAAQKARKIAKKVEISTSAMVTGGQPIIRDYTEEERNGTDDAPSDQVIPLKKRRISE